MVRILLGDPKKDYNGDYMYRKGPCTQIVYTLGPMYFYREYFKANVSTI